MIGFELFAAASLSAALAGITGWPLRRLARLSRRSRRPLSNLDGASGAEAPDPPAFTGIYPAHFQSSHDQGAFGEALTFAIMAAQGWRPVNGKPGAGPQGIDGIFWKRGGQGWAALLIETKTNTSGYRPVSMSNDKLIADLDRLYLTAGEASLRRVYEAISKGLQSGDERVSKQLWRHQLGAGRTVIDTLGPQGETTGARRHDAAHIAMEGLMAGIGELDRQRIILNAGAR